MLNRTDPTYAEDLEDPEEVLLSIGSLYWLFIAWNSLEAMFRVDCLRDDVAVFSPLFVFMGPRIRVVPSGAVPCVLCTERIAKNVIVF